MSTADGQPGAKSDWLIESEIDDDLARVRCGEQTRWFVRDTPQDEPVGLPGGTSEAQLWTGVVEVEVDGCTGLLIPRYEGGLLVDALRTRGGMGAALALGVLDEVLEVLKTAPPAPDGFSRIALHGLAVDGRGDIALLPGRMRHAAARTDSAELGELLHLALTGQTWEETGLPLAVSAPEVPVPVATLVTDLLEAADSTADGDALRARILPLGPSRGRGFLPAEPGVADDATPTGTIGADLVQALRGGPPTRSRGEGPGRTGARKMKQNGARTATSHHSSAVVGERKRSIGTERRWRKRRARHPKTRRFSPATLGVLGLCVAAACAGVAIMLMGANENGHQTQTRASTTSAQPGAASAHGESDPLTAVQELSRLRVEAFSRGDEELLARLTVPGSPAAYADTGLDLQECAECAMELADVGYASSADVTTVDDARLSDAWVEETEPLHRNEPTDGQQAYVRAAMRTEDTPVAHVIFVLEWHTDEWRVHSVQEG